MSKRMKSLVLVLGLAASGAHAACSKDSAPTIPDGKSASEEQMKAAMTLVKSYVASGNAYLACLQAPLDAEETTPEEKVALTEQYNAAVDEMQAVGGQWKQAVADFKAK